MKIPFGTLTFEPVLAHPDLVAAPVLAALRKWQATSFANDVAGVSSDEILVSEIDPAFSDSQAFCEKYTISPQEGANCLITQAKRGKEVTYAACLVPINARADLNHVVRKHLNARQVSFAPMDFAVKTSGMEYGGITILGLPAEWQLLIDENLIHIPHLIIGSGLRRSKLLIPGKALTELPNASVLQGLTIPLG